MKTDRGVKARGGSNPSSSAILTLEYGEYRFYIIIAGWSNEHRLLAKASSCTGRQTTLHTLSENGTVGIYKHRILNLINIIAGWSSPVARRAHNPKVAGSNPVPATKWSRGVAVNMPACHAGDRRFDPGRDRHFFKIL